MDDATAMVVKRIFKLCMEGRGPMQIAKFLQEVMEQKLRLSSEEAIRRHRTRLAQAEKRLVELDGLFIRIYADNAGGCITDERFSMMSKTYEDEQAQLKVEIQTLQQEIEVQER